MLYEKINIVYSEKHTKHVNKLCGTKIYIINAKYDNIWSNHYALKVSTYWLVLAVDLAYFILGKVTILANQISKICGAYLMVIHIHTTSILGGSTDMPRNDQTLGLYLTQLLI